MESVNMEGGQPIPESRKQELKAVLTVVTASNTAANKETSAGDGAMTSIPTTSAAAYNGLPKRDQRARITMIQQKRHIPIPESVSRKKDAKTNTEERPPDDRDVVTLLLEALTKDGAKSAFDFKQFLTNDIDSLLKQPLPSLDVFLQHVSRLSNGNKAVVHAFGGMLSQMHSVISCHGSFSSAANFAAYRFAVSGAILAILHVTLCRTIQIMHEVRPEFASNENADGKSFLSMCEEMIPFCTSSSTLCSILENFSANFVQENEPAAPVIPTDSNTTKKSKQTKTSLRATSRQPTLLTAPAPVPLASLFNGNSNQQLEQCHPNRPPQNFQPNFWMYNQYDVNERNLQQWNSLSASPLNLSQNPAMQPFVPQNPVPQTNGNMNLKRPGDPEFLLNHDPSSAKQFCYNAALSAMPMHYGNLQQQQFMDAPMSRGGWENAPYHFPTPYPIMKMLPVAAPTHNHHWYPTTMQETQQQHPQQHQVRNKTAGSTCTVNPPPPASATAPCLRNILRQCAALSGNNLLQETGNTQTGGSADVLNHGSISSDNRIQSDNMYFHGRGE